MKRKKRKVKRKRKPEPHELPVDLKINSFGGFCPVQAEGTVNGCPFYFRARGMHWSMSIVAPNCEPCFPDRWTWGGGKVLYERWERYGHEPFEAGYMNHDIAKQYIAECARDFVRGSRGQIDEMIQAIMWDFGEDVDHILYGEYRRALDVYGKSKKDFKNRPEWIFWIRLQAFIKRMRKEGKLGRGKRRELRKVPKVSRDNQIRGRLR